MFNVLVVSFPPFARAEEKNPIFLDFRSTRKTKLKVEDCQLPRVDKNKNHQNLASILVESKDWPFYWFLIQKWNCTVSDTMAWIYAAGYVRSKLNL